MNDKHLRVWLPGYVVMGILDTPDTGMEYMDINPQILDILIKDTTNMMPTGTYIHVLQKTIRISDSTFKLKP